MEPGRQRVIIEGVKPELDCGAFPIKRTVGERVVVEADVFTEGHDRISCVLLYRKQPAAGQPLTAAQAVLENTVISGGQQQPAPQAEFIGAAGPGSEPASVAPGWQESPMVSVGPGTDRWRGEFTVDELGVYEYIVLGWIDRFKTWAGDLSKRVAGGQDVSMDLRIGCDLIDEVAARASGADAETLGRLAGIVRTPGRTAVSAALSPELADLMYRYDPRRYASIYGKTLQVTVDRERARFGAWYELFPRSTSPQPGAHGTLRDVEAQLPYVAGMGFDVLYLPPIHPIGRHFRKGRNNAVQARPTDPGSPWAIGDASSGAGDGGHKSIHPELGTLADFRRLVERAAELNIEIALDIAFQVSPDHPYVKQHPEWFRHRPDGSIQYAENPPKKYQDIYPFDFESEDWQGLWQELRSIILYWIEQGVRIFRVDNPHTKAFPFWQWLIPNIKADYPDTIFLAEAFTRPKVMQRLAKLGFTQSYTYFAWRNTRHELTEYLTELTQSEVREYLRPNLWPNTPDILTEYLQVGGRPASAARLVLAATLGASYGIYGPAFELCENRAIEFGKEEYLNSEKYEIRSWDLDRPDSLAPMIGRVNAIRRENPALHSNDSLRFHGSDNDSLICYSKQTEDKANVIVTVVNLDSHYTQAGYVTLDLTHLGLDAGQPYQVHDLLSDARFLWHGARNYVELNPHQAPAHIFRLRRYLRREHDFDYYL